MAVACRDCRGGERGGHPHRRPARGVRDPPVGPRLPPADHALATIGQTFPPAAVLALAVPALGFGPLPTLVALFLYGPLPIITECAGRDRYRARCGKRRRRRDGAVGLAAAARCRLPLAAPAILPSVRVSVTISDRHRDDRLDGRHADPRHADFRRRTPPATSCLYVIQGAVLVALFNMLTDMLFARLEDRLRVPQITSWSGRRRRPDLLKNRSTPGEEALQEGCTSFETRPSGLSSG